MSRLLTCLTVVALLALARTALAACLIALAIMLLFYSVTRPRQTLTFIANVVMLGLATTQPAAFVIAVGVVGAALVLAGAWQRRRNRSHDFGHSDPSPARRLDRDLLG